MLSSILLSVLVLITYVVIIGLKHDDVNYELVYYGFLRAFTNEVYLEYDAGNSLESMYDSIKDSGYECLGLTLKHPDVKTIIINQSQEVWQNFGKDDNNDILTVMYMSKQSRMKPECILVLRNYSFKPYWETFDNLPEWAKLEQ